MRLTLSALVVAGLVGFGSLAQAAPISSQSGANIAPSSEIVQVAKKKKKKAKKMKRSSVSAPATRA